MNNWIARFTIALVFCYTAQAVVAAEISLTVTDADGSPLPSAVVWLPGGNVTPRATPYVMNQRNRQFEPGVLAVPTGSRVAFPNSDSVMHHVYSFSPVKRFEIKLYKDSPGEPLLFPTAGVVQLGCNIHDWMLGYIVVVDADTFAVTDAEGKVSLSVDGDSADLSVWHARFKNLSATEQHTVRSGAQVIKVAQALTPAVDPYQADEFDGY
ncbi:methylamine utilization protein [Gilvimarinus sp. SDUM040013]|uniref:Methylamine utilization protein n=1 Tax=Gilvimarinus gilvus TaxID=3058038 RepID=A0ABU4S104_9GAMM|nr:methylamine utilization protein [Gilvimarinus sp. SDUM040013]MDO3384812.1 methylamine utilization protein [Gilvimarinus sp. SDUM040013]MDX6850855.1 methylamine utilization protein [Gilvimarinus sp. SDUM040013]